MNRRAELLAKRVEEGAKELAEFVASLTETEWNMPVTPTDRRTVGQVVNHVALVYPIEIDLARAIAGGNAVTDVTWAVVADLNATHAKEHSRVSKDEALALLAKNSAEAAAATRTFTDAQLERAAEFGLAYNAPVTAQFVLEDHAVRHSWHHLWRIKACVERVRNGAAQATAA